MSALQRVDGLLLAEPADEVLGLVRKHQGHLEDAERLLRQSIAIREKSLGHLNGNTARGLFDLATILAMRGKDAEVVPMVKSTG